MHVHAEVPQPTESPTPVVPDEPSVPVPDDPLPPRPDEQDNEAIAPPPPDTTEQPQQASPAMVDEGGPVGPEPSEVAARDPAPERETP